jgi:hypothetical protein
MLHYLGNMLHDSHIAHAQIALRAIAPTKTHVDFDVALFRAMINKSCVNYVTLFRNSVTQLSFTIRILRP